MCKNECLIYRDTYASATQCPICGQPRDLLTKRFFQWPLERRIKRWFANPYLAKLLLYGGVQHVRRKKERLESDEHGMEMKAEAEADQSQISGGRHRREVKKRADYSDIYDGMEWNRFKMECTQPHDLAFGLSTDGVAVHKYGSHGRSVWPITATALNLPSWIRSQRRFMWLLGLPPDNPKQLHMYIGKNKPTLIARGYPWHQSHCRELTACGRYFYSVRTMFTNL